MFGKAQLERALAPHISRLLGPAMRSPAPASWKRALWKLANRNFLHHPIQLLGTDRVGNRLVCQTNDIVQKHIAVFSMWEPNLTNYLLTKQRVDGIFLDIGANIGYYSLLASRIFSNVVSFEPSPRTHALLRQNIELNARTNIIVHQAAVTEAPGQLQLYRADNGGDLGVSSLLSKANMTPEAIVRCAPLQEFLFDDDWRRVRFIKIDVEGAEAGVIASLLKSQHLLPSDVEITVETDGSDDQRSVSVFRTLTELGFQAFDLRTTYSLDEYLGGERPRFEPARVTSVPHAYTDCLFLRQRSA